MVLHGKTGIFRTRVGERKSTVLHAGKKNVQYFQLHVYAQGFVYIAITSRLLFFPREYARVLEFSSTSAQSTSSLGSFRFPIWRRQGRRPRAFNVF